jgi:hypothetical protein
MTQPKKFDATKEPLSVVSREVATADAVFVLRWLLQMHEHSRREMHEHGRRGKIVLPDNIEQLARRALIGFADEVGEQEEFERLTNSLDRSED